MLDNMRWRWTNILEEEARERVNIDVALNKTNYSFSDVFDGFVFACICMYNVHYVRMHDNVI